MFDERFSPSESGEFFIPTEEGDLLEVVPDQDIERSLHTRINKKQEQLFSLTKERDALEVGDGGLHDASSWEELGGKKIAEVLQREKKELLEKKRAEIAAVTEEISSLNTELRLHERQRRDQRPSYDNAAE